MNAAAARLPSNVRAATLQMGIGGVPDSVLSKLNLHKNLGIHSEMFSDGVLPLLESGVITNAWEACATTGNDLTQQQEAAYRGHVGHVLPWVEEAVRLCERCWGCAARGPGDGAQTTPQCSCSTWSTSTTRTTSL